MKKYERGLKEIPELVERLRSERARQKDYMVHHMSTQMITEVRDAKESTSGALLRIQRKGAEPMALGIMEQAHLQIAAKTEIPTNYYRRMLGGSHDDRGLMCENVNHWLSKEPQKKRMIRTIDGEVRAFLSSKYRPISHLDLVTQLVQVATNQIGASADRNWAEGARCFAWDLSPLKMDVCFVNPRWGIDLEAMVKTGLQHPEGTSFDNNSFREFGPEELGPDGFYTGRKDPGTGWIFPAIRMRNSETGHGGMSVAIMLFEGACLNGSVFGASVAKVHLGKELEEVDLWSAETMQKMNRLIFSQVRDITLATFKPEGLMKVARKFKGLEVIEVDARKAADQIVELNGLTEEVRDEILDAYFEMTKHRGNLFDLQRGITAAAHIFREAQPDLATQLEEIGGDILERGAKALVA